MPKTLTIPIEVGSPITDSDCTSSFLVRWKPSYETTWTSNVQLNPSEVVITNLLDATEYNIEIIRNCCNGLQSAPESFNHTTGA